MSFHFGQAARIWLSTHRIAEADIAMLEQAVEADRALARLTRPPSLAAAYRRMAKAVTKPKPGSGRPPILDGQDRDR